MSECERSMLKGVDFACSGATDVPGAEKRPPEPETPTMKLSDTQRAILTVVAQHPEHLACPPERFSTTTCCPSSRGSGSAMIRVATSTPPPRG